MTEVISPTRDATLTLREITEETVDSILNLKVSPAQEQFVANNAVSLAQAHFSKYAWFRAIYADETPVGFILLYDNAWALGARRLACWWTMSERAPTPQN